MGFAGAMALAMALDALWGWPGGLFARIGHPVTWLGALINLLDARPAPQGIQSHRQYHRACETHA